VRRARQIAAALLALATVARADEPPIGRAAILDDLHAYYDSERVTGLLFGGLGVVSAGAGTALVFQSGDFERGLGWTLLSMGALEILGGGYYALAVGGEIRHYSTSLKSDAAAFKVEEGTHIEGTISRFPFYRVGELVVAAAGIGVAAYGFASKHPVWGGIGVGVAGESLSLFTLDAFGQARAHAYDRQIRRFYPTLALSVGGGDHPWGASVSGRF